MILNQSMRAVMLALVLGVYLWLGVRPDLAMAAPLPAAESSFQGRMQIVPEASLALKSEVRRFLTSIPDGYYAITNVNGLKSQVANPDAVLVDVREPSEYRSGHIPNAINISLRTLTDNLDKLDRDRPIVLYCSSGHRSAMGVVALHLLGYENVQGFPPSLAGWKAAGGAITGT